MITSNDPAPTASQTERSVIVQQLSEWLQSPTRDTHARLLDFTPTTSHINDTLSTGSSERSSEPPARTPEVNTSDCAPSLYHNSDATPTETSVNTGLASVLAEGELLEESNGILVQPAQQRGQVPVFECAFWFLSCAYHSLNDEEWETHVLSHFQGEEPPRSVQCMRCDFAGEWHDGWTAWYVSTHILGGISFLRFPKCQTH